MKLRVSECISSYKNGQTFVHTETNRQTGKLAHRQTEKLEDRETTKRQRDISQNSRIVFRASENL